MLAPYRSKINGVASRVEYMPGDGAQEDTARALHGAQRQRPNIYHTSHLQALPLLLRSRDSFITASPACRAAVSYNTRRRQESTSLFTLSGFTYIY